MGMGTPVLAIGTSAGRLLPRVGPWMAKVKWAFGVLLLAVAVYLLERIAPGWATMLLVAALLVAVAVGLGTLAGLRRPWGGWSALRGAMGAVLLVYAGALVVGAGTGATDPLRPLHNVLLASDERRAEVHFKRIKGLAALEAEIDRATAQGHTVLLDYYADWCITCKQMEKYTFSNPGVQAALENTILLQADVTENDEQDKALLRRFGLYGPPAILFFGLNGEERRRFRVIGYMDAEAFGEHVRRALA